MNTSAKDLLSKRSISHRRALHAIPEVGLELPKTLAYIEGVLNSCGIKAVQCGGGIIADVGDTGPLVAMRADMDALPMAELGTEPYRSQHPGFMHACGHDAHAGVLLACAEAYAESPPLGFRVRLLFQPGEEGHFGANKMIDAGCLDGVVAIVGGHVGDLSSELEPGQAGFMAGSMMASTDGFGGRFIGSGGHGAAPHQARDPIPALAQFVDALQAFRNRVPDQRKPFVVSVCQISAGSASNVIPGEALFKGTARTLEPNHRELARAGIERACKGIALVHGLEYEFEWFSGYTPLINDPVSTSLAMAKARDILGAEHVKEMTVPSMGGEDFSYYLQKIPGCFWFLNTQAPELGVTHPNHHPHFNVDERIISRLGLVNMAVAEALAIQCGQ
ncbi:MAG: M20 family metallopeptidase [Spirochaetia bacterium]|nr:M20 family metallopeptidase [Spirochaetia bacterium]